MNTLEIAGIIFGGLTVIGALSGWIFKRFNEKNEEIKEKDGIIDSYKNKKIDGISDIEKEFNNHVKENSDMEREVAILKVNVANIEKNLNEFKKETNHNFEAIFFKIDKIFENQNNMSKDVVALTEAVKSLRNNK